MINPVSSLGAELRCQCFISVMHSRSVPAERKKLLYLTRSEWVLKAWRISMMIVMVMVTEPSTSDLLCSWVQSQGHDS